MSQYRNVRSRISQIRKLLTTQFMTARERVRSRNPERRQGREGTRSVTICGFPRSGTSLLFNMMAATIHDFQYEKRERSVMHMIWRRGNWLNKTPNDVFRVSTISRVNFYGKRFDVIVVLRDIRDVITSVHPEYPDRYYVSYESRHNPRVRGWRSAGIGQIYEEMKQLRAAPPAGCTLSFVKYEDLVRDPDAMQQTIATTHSLTFDGRFSNFLERRDRLPYVFAEGATRLEDKPIDRSRAGKWSSDAHRARIRDQFMAHPELFTILSELGYELDNRWFESF